MSAIYPLSIHRRIERQWAERIKSLKTLRWLYERGCQSCGHIQERKLSSEIARRSCTEALHGQIVVATERALQHPFNNGSSLIPVAVRTVVDRGRLDQLVPHD